MISNSCYDIFVIISSVGVVLAAYSIAQVNSIRNFDGVINTAINNLTSFVEDTQMVSYALFMYFQAFSRFNCFRK